MEASAIMTKDPVVVHETDSMVSVAETIARHRFSGLPVVDKNGLLVGIVTEYDLISKAGNVHIPTFVKIIKDLPVYKKDVSLIKKELADIFSLAVKDIINPNPLTVSPSTEISEVAKLFAEHHKVNPIPVIDADRRVVGIISRTDLLSLYNFPGYKKTEVFSQDDRAIDKKIEALLNGFESDFLVVSRARPIFWKALWIAMMVLGFILGIIYLGHFDIRF